MAGHRGNQGAPRASDRFEIREKLGAGGMGAVYLAFDRKLHSEVALKTLLHADGRALYRFKREFRAMQDVWHPNLMSLHELHTNGDEWFFTAELVRGVSYSEYARPFEQPPRARAPSSPRDPGDVTAATGVFPGPAPILGGRSRVRAGKLDVERLRHTLAQLADGVCALHAVGKIHRDLKPANVLVDDDGRVVLLDFGLVGEVDPVDADKTHEMVAVGTPMYMSPEQAADVPLTSASDWYSVGVMLYEALTGVRPFERAARGAELFLLKQTEDPTPARELAPDAPDDLLELCDQLLVRDPSRRADGRRVLSVLGLAPSAATAALRERVEAQPFVGRARELAVLHEAYRASREGTVVVLIRGGAGMGKTMLAKQFFDSLPDEDRPVILRGRSYERESVPHRALDTLMDSLSRLLMELSADELERILPADISALSRLFPVLNRVPAIAEPAVRRFPPADPVELRRRALHALGALLGELAESRPLVLHIEDAHWGDRDGVQFLSGLVLSELAPRMLVVGSYRPEDYGGSPNLAHFMARVEAAPAGRFHVLDLGPLEQPDVERLVELVTGTANEGQAARLLAETDGSPMLVAEVARADLGDSRVSLSSIIAARIDALQDNERRLVRICALAVEPIPSELALLAAGVPGAESLVTQLRALRMIRSRRAATGSLIEPYHDRIREVAVASLTADERRALHGAIATALEGSGNADPEQLVEHWLGADDRARVVRAANAAAEAAEARCAFHRAADYHRIALECSDGDASLPTLARLGDALRNAGRLDDAATVYARAATLASGTERLLFRHKEIEQLLRRGRLDESERKVQALSADIGVRFPRSGRRAMVQIAYNRVRQRLTRGPTGEPGRVTADEAARLEMLWSLATSVGHLDPIRGAALQARFVRDAFDTGDRTALVRALSLECGFLACLGYKHRDRVEQMHARAAELAEEVGDPTLKATVEYGIGVAYMVLGMWRASARCLETSEALLRDNMTGERWTLDTVLVMRTATLHYCGEIAALAELVPTWLDEARERGDTYATRGLQGTRGNTIWLASDDPDQARERLEQVRTRYRDTFHLHHFYELTASVHIDLYGDDPTAAYDRIEERWPAIVGGPVLRVEISRIEAWYLRARAALRAASSTARGAEARGVASAAAARLEREIAPWAGPIANSVRAALAQLDGRTELAARTLRATEASFESLDMHMHALGTRLALASLVGGAEGEALRGSAESAMVLQRVVRPASFARVFVPVT